MSSRGFSGGLLPPDHPLGLPLPPSSTPAQQAELAYKRRNFLKEWGVFTEKLDSHYTTVRWRARFKFSMHERMPPQEIVEDLAHESLRLTKEWYGVGNVSALYEFLVSSADYSGEGAYRFDMIERVPSHDNFLKVSDGRVRSSFYKKKPAEDVIKTGNLNHMACESPIDNTVLPNIFNYDEARMLLAGGLIKENVVVPTLRKRQEKLVGRLCRHARLDYLMEPPHALIRAVEEAFLGAAAGRNRHLVADFRLEDLSVQTLLNTGTLVESWGQIPDEMRQRAHDYIRDALKVKHDDDDDNKMRRARKSKIRPSMFVPDSSTDLTFSQVVDFCRKHPGRKLKDHRHTSTIMLGVLAKKLVLLTRRTVQKYTIHRYVPVPWTRTIPLIGTNDDGTELTTVREAGDAEASRFRNNDFPYMRSHGMGISSGGIVEGANVSDSFGYEMGAALSTDEAAKVGNWFLTDIEKMAQEALLLNPSVPIAMHDCASCLADGLHILPGDVNHDVTQNSKQGSSISVTQHTQVSQTTAKEWPVYHELVGNPQDGTTLGCLTVDLIQMGKKRDAFFLKFETASPTDVRLLNLLKDLRVLLMRQHGRRVDFQLRVMPTGGSSKGGLPTFLFIFAPCADALNKEKLPSTAWVCTNAVTLERNDPKKLPYPFFESGTVMGVVAMNSDRFIGKAVEEGRQYIGKVFDFAAVPGARDVVCEKLSEFSFEFPEEAPDIADADAEAEAEAEAEDSFLLNMEDGDEQESTLKNAHNRILA